ncbi:hypothetical protein B23_1966 [Geobacillus thermoleovorans B23]|nr:hypothetical protein B23_1966 [Geobacillus thermoleovorans B23]
MAGQLSFMERAKDIVGVKIDSTKGGGNPSTKREKIGEGQNGFSRKKGDTYVLYTSHPDHPSPDGWRSVDA